MLNPHTSSKCVSLNSYDQLKQSKFSSTPHLERIYISSTHHETTEIGTIVPISACDTHLTGFPLAGYSAYLLVSAVHWIRRAICCSSIHSWIMSWHCISISIIQLPPIVCTCPLVAILSSKLQHPNLSSKTNRLDQNSTYNSRHLGLQLTSNFIPIFI